MNNTNINITQQEPEEEGLDIMALVRSLWDGRKTIIICTAIFIVLGIVGALTMKRTYTVKTVMVPQMGGQKSGLSSLASLAGFDLATGAENGELSPLVYPQIVNSIPFRLEMMHTPLHYSKCDTLISMFDYVQSDYNKPTAVEVVLKYTIGLPGVIMGLLRKEPPEVVLPSGGKADDSPRPVVVSVKEQKMIKAMDKIIALDVDKKEGFVTLTVNGSEPIQTAELALKAQKLLQKKITDYRIEKSKNDLQYIEARYEEIKAENDRNQNYLAAVSDRTQNVATQRATVERSRAQTKFNVSNSVFLEMSKQLEQAKMQVKKDTPIFTIIEPVTVPMKASNSRAKKVVVWTFLGFMLGCGIVLLKYYWPTLMEKLKKPEEEDNTTPKPATTPRKETEPNEETKPKTV